MKLDYPAIISLAAEAYSKFSQVYFDMGCDVRLIIIEEEREEEQCPGSNLLWDDPSLPTDGIYKLATIISESI